MLHWLAEGLLHSTTLVTPATTGAPLDPSAVWHPLSEIVPAEAAAAAAMESHVLKHTSPSANAAAAAEAADVHRAQQLTADPLPFGAGEWQGRVQGDPAPPPAMLSLEDLTCQQVAALFRNINLSLFVPRLIEKEYDGDILHHGLCTLDDVDKLFPEVDSQKKSSLLRKLAKLRSNGVAPAKVVAAARVPPRMDFVARGGDDGDEFIGFAERNERSLLRRGLFGPAYLMRGEDSMRYAVVVANRGLPGVMHSIERMAMLNNNNYQAHPNVMRYFGTVYLNEEAWIKLEYCEQSMCELVDRSAKLRGKARGAWRSTVMTYMTDLAKGLAFLHKRQLVHGELHLGSIFLTADGARVSISLCDRRVDFSSGGGRVSAIYDAPESLASTSSSGSGSGSGSALHALRRERDRGSAAYEVPVEWEEERGRGGGAAASKKASTPRVPTGAPADVWALGLITLEMAGGAFPPSCVVSGTPLSAPENAENLDMLQQRAIDNMPHLTPAFDGMLRTKPSERSPAHLAFKPALRVLIMSASASAGAGAGAADITKCGRAEVEKIKEAHCEPGRPRLNANVKTLRRGGPRQAWAALEASNYNIFHFIGHGGIANNSGELTLVFGEKLRPRGAAKHFDEKLCTHDMIVRMVKSAAKRVLNLVVLMACNTESIALRLANEAGVDYVIAWRTVLDNEAAVVFSAHLHLYLHQGLDPPAAYRKAIDVMNIDPDASCKYIFRDPDEMQRPDEESLEHKTVVGIPILLRAPPSAIDAPPSLGGLGASLESIKLTVDEKTAMWKLYGEFFRTTTHSSQFMIGLVRSEAGDDADDVAHRYANAFRGMYPGGTFCVNMSDESIDLDARFDEIQSLLARHAAALAQTSGAEADDKVKLLVATGVMSEAGVKKWARLVLNRDFGRCDIIVSARVQRERLQVCLGDVHVVIIEVRVCATRAPPLSLFSLLCYLIITRALFLYRTHAPLPSHLLLHLVLSHSQCHTAHRTPPRSCLCPPRPRGRSYRKRG